MNLGSNKSQTTNRLQGSFFAEMEDSEILRYSSRCHWQDYPSEAVILRHSDSDNDVLFVQSGLVRATAYSPEGRTVVFRDIGPGEVVGDFAAIDKQPRSADVYALADTRIARMNRADFIDLLDRHPSCMRIQLHNLVSAVREMTNKLYEVTTLNACNRIRVYLLRRAREVDPHSNMVTLPTLPPQNEIASLLGTQREVVSREFRRLQADAIIKRNGEQLVLYTEKLEQTIGLI